MKNKNGFISMSVVYAFLIVFLFIMLAIIACYDDKNKFLEAVDEKISIDIGTSKEGKSTILNKLLEDNIVLSTSSIAYSNVATTTNGRGLFFEDLDNGKRVYFFRGAVSNNYILFAEEKPSGNRICWRILHTNEDGTIRLIYSGILNNDGTCTDNNAYIDASLYNNSINDNAYVGYTYAQAGVTLVSNDYESARVQTHYYRDETIDENEDEKVVKLASESVIKAKLENWYRKNTNLSSYSNIIYGDEDLSNVELNNIYIADTKYCADRTVDNTSIGGYNNVSTIYGSRLRITNNIKPRFDCEKSDDVYSLSVFAGGINSNVSAITSPVGLITVDEVRYAGGALNKENKNYFLYTGSSYWTMSPDSYETQGAKVFIVDEEGKISSSLVNTSLKIRPVISITADALISKGTGYMEDPYIIW